MAYKLLYTKKAAKDIEKIDIITKKRLRKSLEKFSKSPLSYATKLVSSKAGDYRFRAGNYRIIFDIDGNKIVILRISHRREVYRNI